MKNKIRFFRFLIPISVLFVFMELSSCTQSSLEIVEENTEWQLLTKAGSNISLAGSVFEVVDEHTSISNEWGARIDLIQGQDVTYSGFVDISTAYNRDFFTYNPDSGKLTFKGETGRWNIRYYQDYNYMWIYPSDALPCLYILGNGKVSSPSWISSIGSISSGFYNYNIPYCGIAPRISETSYQSTLYLSDDNDWRDVRLEIYSDNAWNKENLILTPQSLFGPDASKFMVLQPGTETCNIYLTTSFVEGYYKFVIFPSSNLPKVYVEKVEDGDYNPPTLRGRLIYHKYSSYVDGDSDLYLYDFSTASLSNISESWTNVTHAMNAHFSPDGQGVVFMGISNEDSWDIYKYDFSSSQPINLTMSPDVRDEDPKYSHDGSKIIFKRNGNLAVLNLLDNVMEILTENESEKESGMPYYSVDDTKAVFGYRDNFGDGLAVWDFETSTSSVLYDKAGISEYYPVTLDAQSFYFAANYSPNNLHDQIYKGFWDGTEAIPLGFNVPTADYSDPCAITSDWTIFSSTSTTSINGSYDLYIGNNKTGTTYSLSNYHNAINSSMNELGADYYE